MRNPHEIDVSKEDIATGGASQAEAEFFGLTKPEEEESMPATRRSVTRRREPETETEERTVDRTVTMVIHTPRHLWGLGATQFHFHNVESTDEAFELFGKMQDDFEWMQNEFADRLADVAALENRISEAQKELLGTLAEETGENLPDLTDYSKTEASKLIRELLAARGATPQTTPQKTSSRRSSTRRRPTSRSRTSSSRSGGRRGSSGRGGRKTGGGSRRGNFNNDAPGSATDKMKDFLLDLCKQAGVDAPTNDELDSVMTFNDVSAEITELREALGYEDN